MNAKAKRRRAVPAPPRPEGSVEAPEAGAAGAAEGRREAPAGCAFPAGGLVLLDQLPASAFRRIALAGRSGSVEMSTVTALWSLAYPSGYGYLLQSCFGRCGVPQM